VKLLTAFFVVSAGLTMAQPAPDPAATGRKLVDLMLAEKYPDAFQLLSPEMQKSIPEPELAKIGAGYKPWGKAEEIGQPETRRAGPNTLVIVPVRFASLNVRFQMAVNSAGQIAAMVTLPGEAAWQAPSYVKPGSFHERPVTVGEGDWKLPGVLSVPNGAGPFPAVVLVHDSGPNDRDETVYANKPFRDIAEGLASRGIVVLRYDKRSRVYRAKMAGMSHLTFADETIDDAVKALALAREQKEVDPQRVFVLGHGLGGYLAPRIAAEDGKLAGVIILGGNARPLEDVITDEAINRGATGPGLESLKIQVARIKKLEDSDSGGPPIFNLPVSYWLELRGYDAAAAAKKLPARILVLEGERDFQVGMKDFDAWKSGLAGKKDATAISYPALNHLFMAGEGKGSEAEYRKPGHVAPEVVDQIAKWITG
jgi:dienelactone hydrolase